MDDDKTEGEDLDSTETVRPEPPVLPERVGPYRILERLGEGGMGVVYLAEQTEPVRRKDEPSEHREARGANSVLIFGGIFGEAMAEDWYGEEKDET